MIDTIDIETIQRHLDAAPLATDVRILSVYEVGPEACPLCEEATAAHRVAELFDETSDPCPVHGREGR